jgi:hypothetical protein
MVKFSSGKRIEFPYSSTYDITAETAPRPSFTLALWSAPRSYEEGSFELMDQKRKRVSAWDSKHGKVVGSCFIYRILLAGKFITLFVSLKMGGGDC